MSKTTAQRTPGDLRNSFAGFTPEEHETHLNFDYVTDELVIYTTKPHVFNHFLKRVGNLPGVKVDRPGRTIRVPLTHVRRPWLVLRARRAAPA